MTSKYDELRARPRRPGRKPTEDNDTGAADVGDDGGDDDKAGASRRFPPICRSAAAAQKVLIASSAWKGGACA